MKNIALVAALALATTTASIRVAAACGGGGQAAAAIGVRATPSTAVGLWPRLETRDGALVLTLAYPRFDGEPTQVYVDSFQVVRDRTLRRLERVLARHEHPNLDVSIGRVDATHWRVTGWSVRA